MKKTNKKGFTLVELIIVIAVIAILAGVLIATFASVIKRANDSAEVQNIKNAEIAQKADDIIAKIEDSNWFGWEDFEASIVAKIAEVVKTGNTGANTPLTSDQVRAIVEDALTTVLANEGNTGLTADQVKTVVENALGTLKYEGVTEAQVRAIVKAASNEVVASQLTAAQVRTIVNAANANNLTAADIIVALGSANIATASDITDAVGNVTTAIGNATAGLATSAQVEELKELIEDISTTVLTNDLEDVVLAKGLNIKLAKSNKVIKTPNDVVEAINQSNPVLGVSSNNLVLLDLENKTFVVVKNETDYPVVYATNITIGENLDNEYKYWTFVDESATSVTYSEFSVYLLDGSSVETVTLTGVGLDVGNINVRTINYNGLNENREVVIRSNNMACGLAVDAPNDIVYHYDSVGSVNIISSDMASYHENGIVSFLEVAGGHIVLEETSKVSAVHFTATGTGTGAKFENEDGKKISIDLSKVSQENMPTFTRDDVTINDNGTYVAEVTTDKTEFVWLFGKGIKEQMVVTTTEGAIAEDGTLKPGVVAGAEDGSVAEQIANPAKRNSEGALVDNNGDEIDVSSVNWSNSNALDSVDDIVYEELKTKEDAINENVVELITTFAQLKDFVENGTKINGTIGADFDITGQINFDRTIVLDLNGHKLSNVTTGSRPFNINAHADVTINGTTAGSEISMPASNISSYGLFFLNQDCYTLKDTANGIYGPSLILNGGTYSGTTDSGAMIKFKTFVSNIEMYGVTMVTSGGGLITCDGSLSSSYTGTDGYKHKMSYNYTTIKDCNFTQGVADNGVIYNVGLSIAGVQISNGEIENTTITSAHGCAIYVTNGVAEIKNCNVTVLQANTTASWLGSALAAAADATVYVDGGTYTGQQYGAYVYTSNGRFIIANATISGTTALRVDKADKNKTSDGYNYPSITVESGTFNGSLIKGTDTQFTITGGTFTADPTIYVDVENYKVTGEGPFIVSIK